MESPTINCLCGTPGHSLATFDGGIKLLAPKTVIEKAVKMLKRKEQNQILKIVSPSFSTAWPIVYRLH